VVGRVNREEEFTTDLFYIRNQSTFAAYSAKATKAREGFGGQECKKQNDIAEIKNEKIKRFHAGELSPMFIPDKSG
jgi:hypothetical protein